MPSQPQQRLQTEIGTLKKDLKRSEKSLKNAKSQLQVAREAFLSKKGSSETEKAKIVERQKEVSSDDTF